MKKLNVKIYNRKTGEIVKEYKFPNYMKFDKFLFYFNMQADKKNFGWSTKSKAEIEKIVKRKIKKVI